MRGQHYCPACGKHYLVTSDVKNAVENFTPAMFAGEKATLPDGGVVEFKNDLAHFACGACGKVMSMSLNTLQEIRSDVSGSVAVPSVPMTVLIELSGRALIVDARKVSEDGTRLNAPLQPEKCLQGHEIDEDVNAVVNACFECWMGGSVC